MHKNRPKKSAKIRANYTLFPHLIRSGVPPAEAEDGVEALQQLVHQLLVLGLGLAGPAAGQKIFWFRNKNS